MINQAKVVDRRPLLFRMFHAGTAGSPARPAAIAGGGPFENVFFLYDVLPKIRDASRISAPGQLPRKEVFLYRSTAKKICRTGWRRARRQSLSSEGGLFPVSFAFFGLFPFPISLFLSFFFPLLFSFVLVFCSGWLLKFPFRLSSSEYVIPLEKCMTSVDCRVISSSHVQFEELKVPH